MRCNGMNSARRRHVKKPNFARVHMKIEVGGPLPSHVLPSIHGTDVDISKLTGQKVLLSFYRFASCPFCNLRMGAMVNRWDEFGDGLQSVAVFDSTLKEVKVRMKRHNPPFEVLADPNKGLYNAVGVRRRKITGFLDPLFNLRKVLRALSKGYMTRTLSPSKMGILPLDVLVNEDGIIEHIYEGRNGGDRMSLDDIIAWSKS